ncbi:cupredoxin family copper-binding protein [Candidatus Pacearchaeota archaeon]|nr:cupredoxin family copper-binding protein [Candidatus Pacearchaeota archaeon]
MKKETNYLPIILVSILIIGAILGGLLIYNNFKNYNVPGNNAQSPDYSAKIQTNAGVASPSSDISNSKINPATHDIKISGYAFSPKSLTVNAGDSVVWTNEDSVSHTVTSDSGSELSSSFLSKGQTYSHTFSQKGTFSYHCSPHPGMKGTIVVQ